MSCPVLSVVGFLVKTKTKVMFCCSTVPHSLGRFPLLVISYFGLSTPVM